jgi:hypothetical protein
LRNERAVEAVALTMVDDPRSSHRGSMSSSIVEAFAMPEVAAELDRAREVGIELVLQPCDRRLNQL